MRDELQSQKNSIHTSNFIESSAGKKIKVSDSVVTKNLMDKILAINVDSASWIRTNETGSQILEQIKSESTVEEIIRTLEELYQVPRELIEEDVISFINNCYDRNLIEFTENKVVSTNLAEQLNDDTLKTVYLDITGNCNLKCPYCYLDEEVKDLEAEYWVNTLKEIDHMDIDDLYITGGEPLLRTDLFDIMEAANIQNIKTVGLLTNGTNISSRNIDAIYNYFNVVQIALDGVKKETHEISRGRGTYEKVLNGIGLLSDALKDSKLDQVLISMTVFHENKTEVSDMVHFAYSKGCNFSFFNVLPAGKAKIPNELNWLEPNQYFEVVINAYKEFSKICNENLKKGRKTDFYIKPSNIRCGSIYTNEPVLNCGLGTKELSIGSDGTVYPCRGFHQPDMAIGNIKYSTLNDLHKKSFNHFSSLSVKQVSDCNVCDIKHFCGGGCRLYVSSRDLNEIDPNCKLYESSIYSAMLCKDKNIDELVNAMDFLYRNGINGG